MLFFSTVLLKVKAPVIAYNKYNIYKVLCSISHVMVAHLMP
jgi:hypothetical protein